MKNAQKNRDKIVESVKKMIVDKNIVRSYIKGETSIQTVTKKGIKFAEPL